MGGIFEAWQNRIISHEDRLRLVLRGRAFLDLWRKHTICHPFHTLAINFISRESFDILIIICESFIKLLRIHRDMYPKFPFFPWLHSTETNEHLYGVARTIKTDFTYLDFLQLVPKIGSLLLGAFGRSIAETKSNATASGYQHTYYKCDRVDAKTLCAWPSDKRIDLIATVSAVEAIQLLEACGVYTQEGSISSPAPRGESLASDIEISADELNSLINEEVPVELYKQSALLQMLQEFEGEDPGRFKQFANTLTPEESQEIQKLSYSQLGVSLNSAQEM